jgi:hypothetical protein
VTQGITKRQHEIERRVLVGFACALVVLQALLVVLAWPTPRMQADAFAICHAGGASGETGTPDSGDKPNILCGLCAHAIAGVALPSAAATLRLRDAIAAPGRRIDLAPIRMAAVPVRAGASRAPPGMI